MNLFYTDIDIRFSMDGIQIHALKIAFERFTRPIPSHSHGAGCYEIHYIPSGYGKLEAEGACYDITPDTLFVTGPHVEHTQIPIQPDPMQEYCVYVKIDHSARNGASSAVIDAFTSTPFWIGKDVQGIHGLLRLLFDELEHRYIGYQNQTGLLLSQLLIYIVRNYQHCQVSRTPFARKNLADAKFVIIEGYFLYEYQTLSLSVLADRLKLSPRQTQRLLTEYYGKSFQEKKTEARMSAAAVLLTDKNRTITSIAEELGYSSSEHFSSAFRKYYQTTPREYRKQI